MKHYSITVAGKVQGVFFRKTMKENADEMGVAGFIKNENDGTVSLEAEAEEKVLNKFLVKCNEGSENSLVTNIYVEEGPLKNYKKFKIVD